MRQAKALGGAGPAIGHRQGPPPPSPHSTGRGDGTVLFISLLYRTWFAFGPAGDTDTALTGDWRGQGGGEPNPPHARPSPQQVDRLRRGREGETRVSLLRSKLPAH